MNKIRLVFFSSAPFSLSLLQEVCSKPSIEVVLCFTKKMEMQKRGKIIKESALLDFCEENKIACHETEIIGDEEMDLIKRLKPDLGLVVAYGVLFKRDFIDLFPFGIFNLHFSLLPFYRGASPVQSALLNGDAESGITLQRINEGLDSGDIVLQRTFSIKNKRSDEVFEKSLKESQLLLENWVEGLIHGTLHYQKQDDKKATFCKKIKKNSGLITASSEMDETLNKYRAFYIWPKTFFKINGVKFHLEEIREHSNESTGFNEAMLIKEGRRLFLCFRKGKIEILRIKMEGKKALLAGDFLNGLNNVCLPAALDAS